MRRCSCNSVVPPAVAFPAVAFQGGRGTSGEIWFSLSVGSLLMGLGPIVVCFCYFLGLVWAFWICMFRLWPGFNIFQFGKEKKLKLANVFVANF